MSKASKDIPPGYTVKDCLAYGSRVPGLLEIKNHNPTKRNASNNESQLLLARLVQEAQTDSSIKVIFIHGGLFYSSGNDISILNLNQDNNLDKMKKQEIFSYGLEYCLVQVLTALKNSVKPIVGLIRGGAIGIGFTITGHFDFIYCSPETKFSTPFMASCQSPEGGSTFLFAK